MTSELKENSFNWYNEIKLFIQFYIESFLVLITIQLVSDKIDNNNINWIKDAKIALLLAIILYIAKMINDEARANISQGIHYGISSVFLAKYFIT